MVVIRFTIPQGNFKFQAPPWLRKPDDRNRSDGDGDDYGLGYKPFTAECKTI